MANNRPLNTQRLDKRLSSELTLKKNEVRQLLAQGKITVDGAPITDGDYLVNTFSQIRTDGHPLPFHQPYYVMLNKPVGVVCATSDTQHKTVIDIIDYEFKDELHIVGRLDLNTSGLVLLTNDSRWSEAITSPKEKVEKHYIVTLTNPITEDYIPAFAQGMYFEFENITTQPATLRILSAYQAHVTLTEGKYHQIKRMFGRFRNPVIALKREKVGEIVLDTDLVTGECRLLTQDEIFSIKKK